MNRFAAIAISVAVFISLADNSHSQEADANTPPAATEPLAESGDSSSTVKTKSIGGMIISGGTLNVLFFGVLGVFSLWAATVILERMFNLRREKLLPDTFAKQLAQLIESGQPTMKEFQTLCESHQSPVGRIFRAGVLRDGRPLPEIEKAMEDAAAREMATIRAKSRPLGVVGNIAPLVGLLGTVVGMIMAFQISSQVGLGKAERLAEGIYLALMTTAAGLAVAIPCLLFASWFQGRAERYMCDIGECLNAAIPSFAHFEGRPALVSDGKQSTAPEGVQSPAPEGVQSTAPDGAQSPAPDEAQSPAPDEAQSLAPDGIQSPDLYRKPIDKNLSARERFIREGVTDTAKS